MPSEVESPMYTMDLQEDMLEDASSDDFCFDDSRSGCCVGSFAASEDVGSGVVAGGAAVWCVETPGSLGVFSEDAVIPPLSTFGPTIPARPTPSTTSTPSATRTTALVANRRRRCERVRSGARLVNHSLDLARAQSRPRAPRRIGSSKNRQDRAATTMVAATWATCRERLGFWSRPGAVSTMIGQCQR